MKRIALLLLATLTLLMSCASNETVGGDKEQDNVTESDANNSNKKPSDQTESDESDNKSDTFKEIDLIDIEGMVSTVDFRLDQDGDTLHWGEKDQFASNDIRGNVWLDGEIVALDMDRFGHGSIVTPSGKIVNTEAEDRIYSTIILDPRSGEVEKFTKDDGNKDVIVPAIFNFREEPLSIAKRRDYVDGYQYFIWYFESNEFVDIDMTEWITKEVGEIENPQYATVILSTNGEKVHVGHKEGTFQYDIETQEFDTLLTEEDNALTLTYTTSDDKYLVYFKDEQDDNHNQPIYGMELETKEKFEIGLGVNTQMLDDGKMFYRDQQELYVYDFAMRESQLLYTIKLKEDEELKFVTISGDSNTIAYAYEIDLEDGEEMKIRVLRR
ncbi:hypothetical protein [Paucisalibacillus globulus]|uniref:hypothetical protein n=1 Tax=Paucisalibacillus globulus TaxID=351095 RepID=UPI00041AA087|nr:hypothetical protein [Paucisalibacillus globulus]